VRPPAGPRRRPASELRDVVPGRDLAPRPNAGHEELRGDAGAAQAALCSLPQVPRPRKFCGTRTCDACPWRTDVPVGRFPPERFRQLRNTVQQNFGPLFACHKTEEGSDSVCVGYLLVEGSQSLTVRLAHIHGRFNYKDLKATGPLFKSYRAMEEANDPDAIDWGDEDDFEDNE